MLYRSFKCSIALSLVSSVCSPSSSHRPTARKLISWKRIPKAPPRVASACVCPVPGAAFAEPPPALCPVALPNGPPEPTPSGDTSSAATAVATRSSAATTNAAANGENCVMGGRGGGRYSTAPFHVPMDLTQASAVASCPGWFPSKPIGFLV